MKQTSIFKSIFLIGIFFFSITINAQEDTPGNIVTDRPDQTESPRLVPKGYIQIETGGFYQEDENDTDFKTTSLGYNTTLLRYGLLDNLELRLGWDNTETKFKANGQEFENTLNGFSTLLLGVKVGITEEKGWLPEIGLLGHLNLPFFAGQDYRPETTGADFRFSFAHTLSDKSSFSYNLGAEWENDSPELAYVYTIVYGLSLSGKVGFYAELYGDLPEDSSANHLWDTGFTYLAQPNLQFDVTVGTGINIDQKLLLSGGVSYRFPN